jgi:hypothetical protein
MRTNAKREPGSRQTRASGKRDWLLLIAWVRQNAGVPATINLIRLVYAASVTGSTIRFPALAREVLGGHIERAGRQACHSVLR